MKIFGSLAALFALAATLLPQAALACSTCYGEAGSPMTEGVGSAILVLMGCVGLVYVGIGKLLWDFRARSKKLGQDRDPA